ncbi:AMP-binding protein [Rubellimicrobium roseum]|uniref:AMP-binding protein n=1 Tax=Rubellimicrobium roseum TaxID=687525 RepID=A0A5C4N660_9RHOB|nr:AMP-binding protein [Rubellimicrobium roseum]TNC65810.1 AMP-binding protein [Rubellimicrobium roseum]
MGRLLKALFRVEVHGLENYHQAGPRFIIVANHVSYLDAPLLATLLPELPTFAISKNVARRWWVRPWLRLVRTIGVDFGSPMSFKHMIHEVRQGRPCMIFPEGRLTQTGGLMKIYGGPAFVADKTLANVLPIHIEGVQHSLFSALGGVLRRRVLPKVTITVGAPRRLNLDGPGRGRDRHRRGSAQIGDMLAELSVQARPRNQTLFEAMLAARAAHGGRQARIEDLDWDPICYDRLVLGSVILGRKLAERTRLGERVGILLPNAVGCVVTFFALQAVGRVPAMLNFSAGSAGVLGACRLAGVRLVLTSRRFVEKGKLEATVAELGQAVEVVYLEDLRASVDRRAKLRGLWDAGRAHRMHALHRPLPKDPAAILFTSGTEGAPKGVALSHDNILANCAQVRARIDFTPRDKVFNALPMFHSFGLTAGMVLPVISGVPLFLYPSPLHYRTIPEALYWTRSTILFGADTFLAGYGKHAHPYDMSSLRYVFAGAERLRPDTRALWAERFGIRILEGYGATETAPVLALNTPMHHEPGSVGRLLPGIQWRVVPVPGVTAAGVLHVKGPNVMLGYVQPETPGRFLAPPDGWYDTGDVVDINPQGFVTIRDRVKRFAKVAGEMVALGAVEELAARLWPEDRHAAAALPDGQRGERVILLTTAADATRPALARAVREHGLSDLVVPRTVATVPEVPLLPTGKVDHRAVRALAESKGRELA